MQTPGPGDALLVVDVQNDFLPGGALGVLHGDEVVAPLNRMIARWRALGLPLVFTRDWHPANHCSFHAQGGPWPPHCVAGTPGARFASSLTVPADAIITSKGTDPQREAYSAFQGTGLADLLRSRGVRRVIIGGLATDYCIRATGIDARAAGFGYAVLTDAVRAVDVNPGDGERALAELAANGALVTTTEAVLAAPGRAE
ncbi:MAG: nicotinamidase [Steroidobacteraceae bacterium]